MNWLTQSFLKFYLWYGGRKFSSLQQVTFSNGKSKEIIVFKGKTILPDAQAVPFLNVIIVGDHLFTEYSENLQKFVLEHEYAHTRAWLVSAILSTLFAFVGLLSLNTIPLIGSFLLLSIILQKIIYLYVAIGYVIFLIIFIFILACLSWPMELHADYSAIKAIGLQNAEKAYEEMLAKAPKTKPNPILRLINRVTHPPFWLTLKLYKRLNAAG